MNLGLLWGFWLGFGPVWPISGVLGMDLGHFGPILEGSGHGFGLFPGLWA